MTGEEVAYFDNAATTYPKPEIVYEFADKFYRSAGVNVGRGQYSLAAKAYKLVEDTRSQILSLYRCENKQVIFTSSATEALNKIILGLGLNSESVVYLSPFEHNSVTRVLHAIARRTGLRIELLPFDSQTMAFKGDAALSCFERNNPSLVVATHASNVCGAVLPISEIFDLSKQYGAITIVDMSQTAGLLSLDIASDSVDFAVFAGHKALLAPFGVGGFICGKEMQLSPVFFGGTGHNSASQEESEILRERIEIGSPNIYAIAGLYASSKWILEKSLVRVSNDEDKCKRQLLELLRSFKNISITADKMSCDRIGVVSAQFKGYSSDEIGDVLSKMGVAVRTGLHCSPYAHDFLNTSIAGTVRLSVSCMTDTNCFDRLENSLKEIAKG